MSIVGDMRVADELRTPLLMDVATGTAIPDLVIRGGRVVNSFTREIAPAEIAISGSMIAGIFPPGTFADAACPVIEAGGQFVIPGLIDSHFHVGGSHMDVHHLARALLARGTTAVATDFYEIYVAGGPAAVRFALDESHEAGLKVLFVPPAHLIGLEQVGTFAWDVSVDDMIEMLGWPEAVGINEPPASAVLARPPGLVALLDATIRMNKVVVGHAPNEVGRGLQAYVAAGGSSDHESRDVTEALAKLRVGMRPMMRHGSASPDLLRLVDLVRQYPASSRFMMFCSDETDPGDLLSSGHMDTKVRLAASAGLDAVTAIEMSTINVAEYYGVSGRLGAIAPGRVADLVLSQDLADLRPTMVIASGRVVARNGEPTRGTTSSVAPDSMVSRVILPDPMRPETFRLPGTGNGASSALVRVIGVEDGTLVSKALESELPVVDDVVLADPERDILRIAVLERHHGSGRVGRGFVSGFGLRGGAVAMTYCHVFHNLLVVGSSDESMEVAARAVAADGGGIAVVAEDRIIGRWPLPIVGVLDPRALADVAESFAEINDALRGIGCGLKSPILSLSFVALPTIPAYGLTDRGLFDVGSQSFVDVILASRS